LTESLGVSASRDDKRIGVRDVVCGEVAGVDVDLDVLDVRVKSWGENGARLNESPGAWGDGEGLVARDIGWRRG
jgi:hypothetical protein